jgi:MFS family permease
MGSDQLGDNGCADPEKKAISPPTDIQAAMMQELTPLSVHETSASTLREVTIKQVAPLVLVLTGATFLNVSYLQLPSALFWPAKTISVQSVVIILPAISRDLNIPETRQQWIVSAYALTSAAFLLLCGKLADVYGKRLLFILGCFWVAATTLGAAFSPVEVCIYIMRALQGLVCTIFKLLAGVLT